MSKRFVFGCLAFLVGLSPALAQQVTSTNPASLVSALQDAGYRAELTKDSLGDPKIDSASGGVNFSLVFYGCADNRDCSSIQFHAGFSMRKTVSLSDMNDWNKSNRFGCAWLDDEGDPHVKFDVNMDEGGISERLFEDTLDLWTRVLSDFVGAIGFR